MKHNNKSGFTLVELMVFFIFISLVLAASTPIITKRVKNIPIKMHHGKYICRPGYQAYYNSTRLVSEENVTQCSFKPPKRASLYKIEMIGGGAGGYDYTHHWEDELEGSGKYTLTGGYSGDGYTNPTDAQLWKIFYHANFTYTTTAQGGERGQSVSKTYTGVTSPHIARTIPCYPRTAYKTTCIKIVKVPCEDPEKKGCTEEKEYECTKYRDEDPDGILVSCTKYDRELRAAEATISSQYGCSVGDWCRTVAGRSITEWANSVAKAVPGLLTSFSTGTSGTGYSASGGSSMGMYIDGKIDYKNYTNGGALIEVADVRGYLSNLIGTYYKRGTTQYPGSCDGWGYYELNNHDGKFDSKNDRLDNNENSVDGKWGYDIMHYNGFEGWGQCATNCERATGGQGGHIETDRENYISGSYSSSRQKGIDASGVCGAVAGPYPVQIGVKSDRMPYALTKTKLNVRHHQVGNGGGAASYRTFYVSNIGNDCILRPSGGGRPMSEKDSESDIRNYEKTLATTLSCNEGTLNLSVDGGTYNTGITQKDYSGFDYYNPDGSFTNPATFTTHVAGEGSPYQPNDVFTKYVIGNVNYGAGGGGSTISDSCTQPHGEYWIYLQYTTGGGGGEKEHQYIPQKECNEATDVVYTKAEEGTEGAIIITW